MTNGSCGCPAPHPADIVFFTSVKNDRGSYRALSGPYPTHELALEHVPADTEWASEIDPRGHWYSYGTFSAAREAAEDIAEKCLRSHLVM